MLFGPRQTITANGEIPLSRGIPSSDVIYVATTFPEFGKSTELRVSFYVFFLYKLEFILTKQYVVHNRKNIRSLYKYYDKFCVA